MINKIKNNIKSDSGVSATIEFIFLILILWSVLITIIDFGLYFNNRNIITNTAQNGARLAAVYGGASDTPVAKQYGSTNTSSPNCSRMGASNTVSCSVVREINETRGLVQTEVKRVNCGPGKTTKIGERTYCEITFQYKGIAGGNLSIASALFGDTTIKMTAESEVVYK